MKVLLIGHGPSAFTAAQMFHELDASLCWFLPQSWVDDEGAEVTAQAHPLVQLIASNHKVKHQKVLRLSKRFLDKNEMTKGSRLVDLFRVVYELTPKELLTSFENSNPSVYAGLSSEMRQSLVSEMEAFEDGDFVIFAPSKWEHPNFAGPGGSPAIGELKLKKENKLFYGTKGLGQPVLKCDQDILIVGSGLLAMKKLLSIEGWLKESLGNRVFIVSTEEMPFENILRDNVILCEKFFRFDEIIQIPFRQRIEEFIEKNKKWNDLEDYEKVKISKPEEPIPQVIYFSGHNVTSVEKMLESERIYATLEMPSFREAKIQKENGIIDLKTIGCDKVFVFTGHEFKIDKYFNDNEEGYFFFSTESADEIKMKLNIFIKKYFRIEL